MTVGQSIGIHKLARPKTFKHDLLLFYDVSIEKRLKLHKWAYSQAGNANHGDNTLQYSTETILHACNLLKEYNYTGYLSTIENITADELGLSPPSRTVSLNTLPTAPSVFYQPNNELSSDVLQGCENLFASVPCQPPCDTVQTALDTGKFAHILSDRLRPFHYDCKPCYPGSSVICCGEGTQCDPQIQRYIVFKLDRLTSITSTSSMSTLQFIGNLGGIFGLFLGASIFSFLQLFVSLFLMPIKLLVTKHR